MHCLNLSSTFLADNGPKNKRDKSFNSILNGVTICDRPWVIYVIENNARNDKETVQLLTFDNKQKYFNFVQR